jgi:hypothetical protein
MMCERRSKFESSDEFCLVVCVRRIIICCDQHLQFNYISIRISCPQLGFDPSDVGWPLPDIECPAPSPCLTIVMLAGSHHQYCMPSVCTGDCSHVITNGVFSTRLAHHLLFFVWFVK